MFVEGLSQTTASHRPCRHTVRGCIWDEPLKGDTILRCLVCVTFYQRGGHEIRPCVEITPSL